MWLWPRLAINHFFVVLRSNKNNFNSKRFSVAGIYLPTNRMIVCVIIKRAVIALLSMGPTMYVCIFFFFLLSPPSSSSVSSMNIPVRPDSSGLHPRSPPELKLRCVIAVYCCVASFLLLVEVSFTSNTNTRNLPGQHSPFSHGGGRVESNQKLFQSAEFGKREMLVQNETDSWWTKPIIFSPVCNLI